MHVVMRCPCGANLKAPVKYVGREMKCPKCATMLVIPPPPTAQASAPVVPELELLDDSMGLPANDPMQLDPFAEPAAHPGTVHPGAQAPARIQNTAAAKPRKQKKQKAKRKTNWFMLAGIAGALFLVFGGYLWWIMQDEHKNNVLDKNSITVNNQRVRMTDLGPARKFSEAEPRTNEFDSGSKEFYLADVKGADEELSMADLIEKVEPSIVRIKVESYEGESIGSGFFLDMEGKIATNYHVIKDATDMTVTTADGKSTKVLGSIAIRSGKDLAIIQIDPSKLNIVPIPIAKNTPRKGESVAAFGAPQGFSFSATRGIISSIRSGKEVSDILKEMTTMDVYAQLAYQTDTSWIQTSTAISGGNSGGPLVNMRGEMIGVNTWTHPGGQNLNFSAAATELKTLFENRKGNLHPFN